MADSKITALTALTAADPANDMLPVVDVSDTSMAASGTTKRISINNLLACSPSATLASATITGDLTVDTNVFKVDTTLNRVGIGTASPSTALDVFGGNIRLVGGNIFQILNTLNDSNVDISNNGSTGVASMLFKVAGTSAMTLNSTGLGVGVSPIYKFHVKSDLSELYFRDNGTASELLINSETGGVSALYFGDVADTVRGGIRYDSSVDTLALHGYNNVARLTIDSSGNVGIGVTPNTWTIYKALQVQGASIFSTTGNDTGFGSNVYYDGGYKFRSASSDKATRYEQFGGSHSWHYTASPGTAGNTATFTQAMTLDASGNLLVGTVTSPTGTKIGSIAKLGGVSVEGTSYISVSTTPVALARAIGTGALFFVAGFNASGGAQGWWLVASTGGAAPTVIASGNSTGLTVAFTTVAGVLNMNTTSGTLSVTAFAITN